MSVGFDLDLEEKQETNQKISPHWHVMLLNDDYHTFPFVIMILVKIFKKKIEEAVELTYQIHEKGQAIATTCSKERALLYQEQVTSVKEGDKGAIRCIIEPAE